MARAAMLILSARSSGPPSLAQRRAGQRAFQAAFFSSMAIPVFCGMVLGRDALAAAMSTSIASIILVISLPLTAPRFWQRVKPAFVGNAPPLNLDTSGPA